MLTDVLPASALEPSAAFSVTAAAVVSAAVVDVLPELLPHPARAAVIVSAIAAAVILFTNLILFTSPSFCLPVTIRSHPDHYIPTFQMLHILYKYFTFRV